MTSRTAALAACFRARRRGRRPVSDHAIDLDDVSGPRPVPMLWPSSRDVLALGIDMLPDVENDLVRDLVEVLLLALVDRNAELAAVRSVLSAALTHAHGQHVENVRLKRRLVGLLDERRIAA